MFVSTDEPDALLPVVVVHMKKCRSIVAFLVGYASHLEVGVVAQK
jgi:hypothetical protein